MKKMFMLFLALMAFASMAFAKTVVATGYGDTPELMLRDALRRAIETSKIAVGSIVTMENCQIKNDIVVTKSQAFITDYKVLVTTEDKIKIQAEVNDELDTQLLSDLVKKGIIESVLNNPKIAVVIDNPEAQAAVVKTLIAAGFKTTNNIADCDIRISSIHVNRSNNGDISKFLGCANTNTQSVSSDIVVIVEYKDLTNHISGHGVGVGISSYGAYKMASAKAGESIGKHVVDYLLTLAAGPLLKGEEK